MLIPEVTRTGVELGWGVTYISLQLLGPAGEVRSQGT